MCVYYIYYFFWLICMVSRVHRKRLKTRTTKKNSDYYRLQMFWLGSLFIVLSLGMLTFCSNFMSLSHHSPNYLLIISGLFFLFFINILSQINKSKLSTPPPRIFFDFSLGKTVRINARDIIGKTDQCVTIS